MTEQKPPAETPETPESDDDVVSVEESDEDSFLDSLIESVSEIPHWLFRPIFGRDKD